MKTFIVRLRACAACLLAPALVLTGCASSTRTATFGPLAGGTALVTLVVSEDPEVVASHCEPARRTGTVLGCQLSWPVTLDDGRPVRRVKIVRYTDALPSALAFEIDIHELCHAVAVLQAIHDPCHEGNDGVAQASLGYGSSAATEIRASGNASGVMLPSGAIRSIER
ncbi:MAG: hypothetical protein FJZ38_23610 [Candidatus Rokubacteria bacterium]|nr:hypothetical protein [Candidatus Rokubacteria bacterium]